MIPRIEALNELTRLSQELGMYDDEPMRICQPCRRILPVSCFAFPDSKVPEACLECEPNQLTEREAQCVEMRFMGYHNGRIAAELGIAKRTVETYISNAKRKGAIT